MKTRFTVQLLAALLGVASTAQLTAQTNAFTYQGQLRFNGHPAVGNYDLVFSLHDAGSGGNQVGASSTNTAVTVSNGLFTVTLDFGPSVFDGGNRWLGIGVRSNTVGSFTALNPRQSITPTPYAMLAGKVMNGAITASQLATGAIGSTALADSIALGDTSTIGQLDVYRTVAGTPAISLYGNGSQISTFGSDGQEQIRLHGQSWGELLLFNSLPNNAVAVDLSADGGSGGYLSLRNSNAFDRALLSGANAGGSLQLYNGTNAESVRLSSTGSSWLNSGRLGLGTANPSTALHITGPTNTPPAGLAAADNGLLLGSQSTSSYKWIQSYGGPLALNPVGNGVGIGTTNPVDSILDVEGDTHINDHDIFLRAGTDRSHGFGYRASVNGGTVEINGPFLYGWQGGCLGLSGPDYAALTWDYLGDIWISNDCSAAKLASRGGLTTVGNAGIGVSSPLHTLHAGTTLGTATINGASKKIVVENSNGNGRAAFLALAGPGSASSATRVEIQLEADVGQNRGIFGTTSNHELQMRINNNEVMRLWTNGNVSIGNVTPTNRLHVAGGVSATAFVSTSDRNAKENFTPVDARQVLDEVVSLPITTWNYKDLHDGRHMGPMAQDFYAAFRLGGGDTTITTVDPDGVALAAIQGLNQKVEETRAENAELREQLQEIKQLLNNLTK